MGLTCFIFRFLRRPQQGLHYNRKTVAASLKRLGLRAKAARKFKATTGKGRERVS